MDRRSFVSVSLARTVVSFNAETGSGMRSIMLHVSVREFRAVQYRSICRNIPYKLVLPSILRAYVLHAFHANDGDTEVLMLSTIGADYF